MKRKKKSCYDKFDEEFNFEFDQIEQTINLKNFLSNDNKLFHWTQTAHCSLNELWSEDLVYNQEYQYWSRKYAREDGWKKLLKIYTPKKVLEMIGKGMTLPKIRKARDAGIMKRNLADFLIYHYSYFIKNNTPTPS